MDSPAADPPVPPAPPAEPSRLLGRVERRADGVAIVWLDQPDKKVNVLSGEMLAEFEQLFAELGKDPAVVGIVVASAKKDSFIAGADLNFFAELKTGDEFAALSRQGNLLLEAMYTAPKPVVAAIHGTALGGGLEVALACQYLVASDHPSTVLGLPETTLGLVPGGGGTQRTLERMPLLEALPVLLAGKRLRAKQARRAGLVDVVTTPTGVVETACRAALQLASGQLRRNPKRGWKERLLRSPLLRSRVLAKAKQQVERKTGGHYPAPLGALACVEAGLAHGRKVGLEEEAVQFGRLAMTEACTSLRGLFLDTQESKKAGDPKLAREVKRLGVLGAGLMGSGIASVSVGLSSVVLRDLSREALGRAVRAVDQGLEKQLRAGAIRTAESERRRSRLLATTEVAELRGVDLVIEAVFEDLALKQELLREVEAVVPESTVFASNTSALPIAAIAEASARPEQVLGMHYFSPVPKMPLLEIVVTEQTSAVATETARAYGQAQGKTVIVVQDGPGFYTTRILAPMLNEAIALVQEGAAIEKIDQALRAFGFPVGPLTLLDEVGIDVGAHVADTLGDAFSHRGVQRNDALHALVEQGFLGRKAEKGLYRYEGGKKKRRGPKQADARVYSLLCGGAGGSANARREFDVEEIQDRVALPFVNEAAWCLQEGVLASARDGDLGAVLGLGFPPFRGGPFTWLDRVGAQSIVDRLERLRQRLGQRFTPAPLLAEHARDAKPFRSDRG